MTFRSIARLGLMLVPATSLSLFAVGCGNGVSTAASEATPTPTQNVTPTPTNTATPTPTASPTPTPSSATCSFVWATDYSSVDGTIDFYEVDVLKDNFNANTNTFGDTAVGYFVVGYDPNSGSVTIAAGMSTAGAMAMTAAGTNMGDAVTFTDSASHTFFDATDLFNGASQVLGAEIATGGTGDFTGNLSDPNPANAATPGTGTITATDLSANSEIFGDPTSLGLPTLAYSACSQ